MIRWPVRSARAISRLFRATQNVDIFVEDQGDELFYTNLFKRAAPEGVSITRVVGLGGCDAVRNAAVSYADQRCALFLIDGDLAWVRGDAPPTVNRLYRLCCYCVENLLISERLISEVCAEEMIRDPAQAKEALVMDDWKLSAKMLVPLFARFAVLNKVMPGVPTVSEGLSKIIVADAQHKLPRLCPEKISKRVAEIDDRITEVLGAESRPAIEGIERRISGLTDSLMAVSGKDFLLPLLWFHMKIISKTSITKEQLRHRLAMKCDRNDLQELEIALTFAS